LLEFKCTQSSRYPLCPVPSQSWSILKQSKEPNQKENAHYMRPIVDEKELVVVIVKPAINAKGTKSAASTPS
jgi:hypothetical protein